MHEDPLKKLESHRSIEILKTESTKRLNDILYEPLSVENIEYFADEALNTTIELVKDLVHEYQTNPSLEGDLTLDIQQQEDAVCRKLELPNIPQILDRIQEVKGKIDGIKKFLEEPQIESADIITPPDQLENPGVITGNVSFEKKKLIPRLLTLMYVLETDFDIDVRDTEQIQVLEGGVTNEMMRQTPYVRVTVPELNRVVYVCDEEGNVSYIFDTERLASLHIPLDDLDIDGKQDKNSLISMYPKTGVRVVQTPMWRSKIKTYLEKELPDQKLFTEATQSIVPEITDSEFKRKSEWLPYKEWVQEIMTAWNSITEDKKPANIINWYTSERLKHLKTWPSFRGLRLVYGLNVIINDLVGVENRLEKEYLSYEAWLKEVKAVWDTIPEDKKPIDVVEWYQEERKNGKMKTWHSHPEKHYKGKGWNKWTGVIGEKFFDFDTFCTKVRELWESTPNRDTIKNLDNWYKNLKKIRGFPVQPILFYKNKGWTGWRDLIKR